MTQAPSPPDTRVALVVIAGGADPAAAATPLSEAETPTLDRIARDGLIGRAHLGAAESWHGFTSLLGLRGADAACGAGPSRGLCAALGAGIEVGVGETAFRADFVTTDETGLLDPFGGGDGEPEASILLEAVAREAPPSVRLFRLGGGRNLAVVPGSEPSPPPTWQMAGRDLAAALPAGSVLRTLYEVSRRVLPGHDVNAVRLDLGENPATALWLHGGGGAPGDVVPPPWAASPAALLGRGAAVRGLASLLEWNAGLVDGGDEDLAAAALSAIADHAVVVVRTESVLAAAAGGDPVAKRDALSALDARLIGPLLHALEERGPFVFAVAADGVVDTARRQFTAEPVPFGLLCDRRAGHGGAAFNEQACAEAVHRLGSGAEFAALLGERLSEMERAATGQRAESESLPAR